MQSLVILCICLATLATAVYGDTRKAPNLKYQEARKRCQDDPKTHLDRETLRNAFRADIFTPIFGAHAVCLYHHLGVLDKHSNINKEELRNSLDYIITDTDKLEEAVEECSKKKKTLDETAVEIFKCSKKAMAPYLPYYDL